MAEELCAISDEITLCYEAFGDPADPPALLVMGLGTQMIAWHEDFCRELAGRGLYVVRFDNRDAGRSTHLSGAPPTLRQMVRRDKAAAHYLLGDMAADAAGLLRELGLAPAHVIGASMGGMIAQTLAARHPDSVRSMVSIMAGTGSRWAGQPALRVYPMFLRRAPRDRDAFVEYTARAFAAIGSPGFPQDLDALREMAGRSFDRESDATGTGRQLAAILASGDRSAELRRIDAPTLVVHGTADKLVAVSGGRATAKAIRGSELLLIDGMGHDLPRGAWPRIIDAIEANVARADPARQPA